MLLIFPDLRVTYIISPGAQGSLTQQGRGDTITFYVIQG